jgi:hypothetical protein
MGAMGQTGTTVSGAFMKTTRRMLGLAGLFIVIASPFGRCDEGMWTFDNLPLKLFKDR